MDYTQIALESLLVENSIWRNVTLNQLVAESEFLVQSLQEGMVGEYVQEVNLSDASKKIMNALRQFLDKLVAMFREKQVKFYEKYVPWVQKNEERILEAAKKGSLTLAPYYDADYNRDLTEVKASISNAFKYPFAEDDLTFATRILKTVKSRTDLEEDTGNLSAILKNRFRFGVEEADNSKIKKDIIKENELANTIGKMITYVTSDYKKIANSLNGLKATWLSTAEKFREAVGESEEILTKDKVMLIEQCLLSQTDLCLLEGFSTLPEFVMELESGEGGGNKSGNEKSSEDESLTSVKNNIKEEEKKAEERGEKPAPRGNGNRYKLVDRFTRLMFSAYLTAAEERFIIYIKAISQVLGESPKKESQ